MEFEIEVCQTVWGEERVNEVFHLEYRLTEVSGLSGISVERILGFHYLLISALSTPLSQSAYPDIYFSTIPATTCREHC